MAKGNLNSNATTVASTPGILTASEGPNAVPITEVAFRERETRIRSITVFREGQFDVSAACTRLFGAMDQIKGMRPAIEQTFRNFDFATFDDFEGRLHAAHYCNALWLSKSSNKVDVASLAAELVVWIRKAKETCEMMIPFGKVTLDQLKRVGEVGGYDGKIQDLSILLSVLRRLGPEALNRTMLSTNDLIAAEVALLTFQGAVGKKQAAPVEREEASVLRLQSLTHMLESFDWALKAASYLYGEAAAKQMVPSPYADRGNRKSSKEPTETEPSPAPTEASTNVGNTITPDTFVMTNPSGLPLTNPFASDDKK